MNNNDYFTLVESGAFDKPSVFMGGIDKDADEGFF